MIRIAEREGTVAEIANGASLVVCGGKVLSKPYPTPKVGISAPQAVSKISGCLGVG